MMEALLVRLKSWEGFLLAVLLGIILVNSAITPQFLTLSNQINLRYAIGCRNVVQLVAASILLIAFNSDIPAKIPKGTRLEIALGFYRTPEAVIVGSASLWGVIIGSINIDII